MVFLFAISNPLYTLHSNLVIFKLFTAYYCIDLYTLYIPIWLYSNGFRKKKVVDFVWLYIPIWLYSNCVSRDVRR